MTSRELMKRAIELAKKSYDEGETPVGAVVSLNGEIVGEGRNRTEKNKNPLFHAEIEAINDACGRLKRARLNGCVLFTTLEPCLMCSGAILNARIEKVVFGAYDNNFGSVDSKINVLSGRFGKPPEIQAGFMENECGEILSGFFKNLRP